MKEKLLTLGILVGLLAVVSIPAIAIFSLFGFEPTSNDSESYLKLDVIKNNRKIESNNKASINMDEVFVLQGETISDEETPLAVTEEKVKILTGAKVKDDFKSHEKEFTQGSAVFEVIDREGHNLFFINYDELDLLVNDKTNYSKQFVLDDDEKLVRYVYLELDK